MSAEVEAEWFRRTGIYPIHGAIVVKTDVLAKHPWLARALLRPSSTAKNGYLERLIAAKATPPTTRAIARCHAARRRSPALWPRRQPASIEALITYALQQQLIPEPLPMSRRSSI